MMGLSLSIPEGKEYDPIRAAADVAQLMEHHRKRLDRAIELYDLEQAGRLVVLPCKVGDILYYFPKWYAKSGFEPEPISVEEVNSFNGNIVVECYMDPDTRISILPPDFGKTVFLTSEEAEAALRGEDNAV